MLQVMQSILTAESGDPKGVTVGDQEAGCSFAEVYNGHSVIVECGAIRLCSTREVVIDQLPSSHELNRLGMDGGFNVEGVVLPGSCACIVGCRHTPLRCSLLERLLQPAK